MVEPSPREPGPGRVLTDVLFSSAIFSSVKPANVIFARATPEIMYFKAIFLSFCLEVVSFYVFGLTELIMYQN